MQKTKPKASILIWSIFLSLIISVGFISISTQINKTLKNNIELEQNIKQQNDLQKIFASKNYVSQSLSNGDYIKFEEAHKYIGSLKQYEKKVFSFSGASNQDIHISILQGSPLKYEYSINNSTPTIGTIQTSHTIVGSPNSQITLQNLGGYSFFKLESQLLNKKPDIKYEITKKIGNKDVVIESGTIK